MYATRAADAPIMQTELFPRAGAPADDRDPRLTVLSFGAGQDSTAILYRLVADDLFRRRYAPHDLLVLLADTGDEHPDTLEHVREIARFCEERSLDFVHLTGDRGFHRGPWAGGLRNAYRTYTAIGSEAYPKTCSMHLKIDPMYRFLETYVAERYAIPNPGRKEALKTFAAAYGPIRVLIGFAADEDRAADPTREKPWARLAIRKAYPLQDLGWNRADCQAYIAQAGRPVPPPSNCMACPFKSPAEILWTKLRYPQSFAEWAELEAAKIAAWADRLPAEKNYGVKRAGRLHDVAAAEYRRLRPQFSDDRALLAYLDEYRMSHGHCVKSKF